MNITEIYEQLCLALFGSILIYLFIQQMFTKCVLCARYLVGTGYYNGE